MPKAIELMAEAFKELSVGDGEVPVRHFLEHKATETTGLFMPALLPQSNAFGIKVVGLNPQNPNRNLPLIHASILVLDANTGQVSALTEGAWITALRTGAGAGLATKLLARQDAKKLLVFGAGTQAKTQIEAVCSVREIDSVKVISRTKEKAKAFCAKMSVVLNKPVSLGDLSDLKDADIICTATTSSTPLFEHRQVAKGVHINAVGAFTSEMAEVPAETLAAAKIYVDRTDACLEEGGDVIQAIRKGAIAAEDICGEIGALAAGKIQGRNTSEDITFFKSVGSAAQDMAVAKFVVKKAEELNLGKRIQL